MVVITARHMAGGVLHEHIAAVRWLDPATSATGTSSREQMVTWLDKGGQASVRDGVHEIAVGVVRAVPSYIRTYADGVWTDNLLALPTY